MDKVHLRVQLCYCLDSDCAQDKWSPALQIRTVLLSIQALLSAPNPEDPLDTGIAKHWIKDLPAAQKEGNAIVHAAALVHDPRSSFVHIRFCALVSVELCSDSEKVDRQICYGLFKLTVAATSLSAASIESHAVLLVSPPHVRNSGVYQRNAIVLSPRCQHNVGRGQFDDARV